MNGPKQFNGCGDHGDYVDSGSERNVWMPWCLRCQRLPEPMSVTAAQRIARRMDQDTTIGERK